jgi:hypothetical protein
VMIYEKTNVTTLVISTAWACLLETSAAHTAVSTEQGGYNVVWDSPGPDACGLMPALPCQPV